MNEQLEQETDSLGIDRTALLAKCICGKTPESYACNLDHKGCRLSAWVVECCHEEEGEPLPFVEHQIGVYGKDQKEAEQRWNKFHSANPALRDFESEA